MKPYPAVYEIVDATSDEAHYPLGIYRTFKAAKEALVEEIRDDGPVTESGDSWDREAIEIRKRPIGWGDYYKVLHKIERERELVDDEWKWLTKEIE